MKKKIFSLVGALVLTCAMSLNVFAADSPQAVKDAAQGVEMPADLSGSAEVAKGLLEKADSADVEISPLADEDQLPIAEELGKLKTQDSVKEVTVVAVFELSGTPGKVVFHVSSTDRETVYAIHIKDDGTSEWIPGDKSPDNQVVTFNFTSFSPVAIVKAEHKPTTPQSGNNNAATTPAVTPAPAPVATAVINGVTVPTAPKTGDNAVAVAAMAVLFMAGAVIAVSRKRA